MRTKKKNAMSVLLIMLTAVCTLMLSSCGATQTPNVSPTALVTQTPDSTPTGAVTPTAAPTAEPTATPEPITDLSANVKVTDGMHYGVKWSDNSNGTGILEMSIVMGSCVNDKAIDSVKAEIGSDADGILLQMLVVIIEADYTEDSGKITATSRRVVGYTIRYEGGPLADEYFEYGRTAYEEQGDELSESDRKMYDMLYNGKILTPDEFSADFNGAWSEDDSAECVFTVENGIMNVEYISLKNSVYNEDIVIKAANNATYEMCYYRKSDEGGAYELDTGIRILWRENGMPEKQLYYYRSFDGSPDVKYFDENGRAIYTDKGNVIERYIKEDIYYMNWRGKLEKMYYCTELYREDGTLKEKIYSNSEYSYGLSTSYPYVEYFDENGALTKTSGYNDGACLEYKHYNENGALIAYEYDKRYENPDDGIEERVIIEFYGDNGILQSKEFYIDGSHGSGMHKSELERIQYYDENGTCIQINIYGEFDFYLYTIDYSIQIYLEFDYYKVLIDGDKQTVTYHYENGNIVAETVLGETADTFIDKYYYENGNIASEGLYDANGIYTSVKYFSEDGILKAIEYYDSMGEVDNIEHYDENGNLIS